MGRRTVYRPRRRTTVIRRPSTVRTIYRPTVYVAGSTALRYSYTSGAYINLGSALTYALTGSYYTFVPRPLTRYNRRYRIKTYRYQVRNLQYGAVRSISRRKYIAPRVRVVRRVYTRSGYRRYYRTRYGRTRVVRRVYRRR